MNLCSSVLSIPYLVNYPESPDCDKRTDDQLCICDLLLTTARDRKRMRNSRHEMQEAARSKQK